MAAKRKKTVFGLCFGGILKNARSRAGLSQRALAARSKCSTVFVSNLEQGLSIPSLEVVIALERALALRFGALAAVTRLTLEGYERQKLAGKGPGE